MLMTVSQQIEELASRSESYVLLQRFSMPTQDGPQDAIAVTFEVSKILLSFYTVMVGFIMLQLWYLVVLVGISVVAKSKRLTGDIGVANVAIWNSQAPLSVIKAMSDYRSYIPLYALMWATAAALAWAVSFTMSLLVSPELIIGAAAPANLQSIYVPETPDSNTLSSVYLRWLSLQVPSNLRAINVLEALNPKMGSSFNVIVQNPITLTDSNGRRVYQVDYSYNLSEVDFGLQHIKELSLAVQGSCVTNYSWFNSTWQDPASGAIYDAYFPYGNQSYQINASLSDGKPPLVTFFAPEQPSGVNISFAAIISSVQRRSFTPGSDPWYLTQPWPANLAADPNGAGYQVLNGRPALSCWQQDMWTSNGQSKGTNEIEQLGALPPALVDVFKAALGLPRIINLAQALGTSALKSAATSQGYYFDAQASSLHDDLERLVLGAYVATKNTLAETTMFSNIYPDIANLAFDSSTEKFKNGAADFVIYGSGFAALRINFVVVVPVITVVLWLTLYLLTDSPCFPLPWAYVSALKASVLYSVVDVETFQDYRAREVRCRPPGARSSGGVVSNFA